MFFAVIICSELQKERERVDVEIFINVYLIVFAVFLNIFFYIFCFCTFILVSEWQTKIRKQKRCGKRWESHAAIVKYLLPLSGHCAHTHRQNGGVRACVSGRVSKGRNGTAGETLIYM